MKVMGFSCPSTGFFQHFAHWQQFVPMKQTKKRVQQLLKLDGINFRGRASAAATRTNLPLSFHMNIYLLSL